MELSPTKMRKRGSPIRGDREHVEFIDLNEALMLSSRRRSKRSMSPSAALCYMMWGAFALFGLSTIALLASSGSRSSLFRGASLNVPSQISRRRLGLKPAPKHTGEGPVKVFTLPDSIRDEIYNEVSNLKVDTSSLEDLSSFIEEVKEIVQSHAPPEFLSALRSLHDATSPTSAVYIRNLPVDPHVPPTPTDGSLSLGKTTYVAEAMLVGFGELTKSHVVGYSAETQYSNPWIHEGFPRTSKGSALTKASDLSFHQDMSYHPQPPDVLGLVCVREGHDKNVNTELVDNREVFELLPDEVIELLRESRFQIKTSAWVDASWDVGNNGRGILSHDSSIALPVDWENMVGLDEEAQAAVELLKEAILAAPKHFVHFVPGDLLLFANRRTVHARTPYADLRFDGGDRVLDRSYFRKELSSEQRRTRLI